jgi:hypothetical protein
MQSQVMINARLMRADPVHFVIRQARDSFEPSPVAADSATVRSEQAYESEIDNPVSRIGPP